MWGWGIGGIGGIRGEGVPDIFTKNNKGGQLIPPYFLSNFLHVVLHFFLCLEAGFFRFTGKYNINLFLRVILGVVKVWILADFPISLNPGQPRRPDLSTLR